MFCGITTISPDPAVLDPEKYDTWQELVDTTARQLHRAGNPDGKSSAAAYQAKHLILQRAQMDCFPDDYALLQADKPVSANIHLITASPEFDTNSGPISVGGRLHRAEELERMSWTHTTTLLS